MTQKLFEDNSLCLLLTYYLIGMPALCSYFGKPSHPLREMAFQAAVQVLAIPLFILMTAVAVVLWFSPSGAANMGDRIFGHHPYAQWLVRFTFWYLMIETFLKMYCHWRDIKDKKETARSQYSVQYLHHICTGLLCYDCLYYTFTEYYAVFYLGVAEASSIALGGMNIFKMSKELATKYPTTNLIVSLCFVFSFLLIRVAWWLKINVSFWRDAIPLLGADMVAERHGVPVLHIYLWLVANALLTLLQLHWAKKVAGGLVNHFTGKKSWTPPPKPASSQACGTELTTDN